VIIQINKEKGSSKSQKLRTHINGKFNNVGSDVLEVKGLCCNFKDMKINKNSTIGPSFKKLQKGNTLIHTEDFVGDVLVFGCINVGLKKLSRVLMNRPLVQFFN